MSYFVEDVMESVLTRDPLSVPYSYGSALPYPNFDSLAVVADRLNVHSGVLLNHIIMVGIERCLREVSSEPVCV